MLTGTLPSKRRRFKCVQDLKEQHSKSIFCIAFNFIDEQLRDVFASVGDNTATIYRCETDGTITPLHTYVDEDPEESFFACKWSVDEPTGTPLLLLAGHKGVLRVLDASTGTVVRCVTGHGDSINDIVVVPRRPHLVLTASKDESLRLWDISSGACILILAGRDGHTQEVLSADVHRNELRFATAGMDSSVLIWDLTMLEALVAKSPTWDDTRQVFPTQYVKEPTWKSLQDCVRWVGELLLSKSVHDEIFLWRPELPDPTAPKGPNRFTLLQEFSLPNSHMWFIRFSLSFHHRIMACGNKSGRMCVWDLGTTPPTLHKLHSSRCKTVVRQTAVSFDGGTILGACDDGTIWRYDDTSKRVRCSASGSQLPMAISPESSEAEQSEEEEEEDRG